MAVTTSPTEDTNAGSSSTGSEKSAVDVLGLLILAAAFVSGADPDPAAGQTFAWAVFSRPGPTYAPADQPHCSSYCWFQSIFL